MSTNEKIYFENENPISTPTISPKYGQPVGQSAFFEYIKIAAFCIAVKTDEW